METINEILSNYKPAWHSFVLTTPCWEWQRAKDDLGYGRVYFEGKNHLVHRLLYKVFVGPIYDEKALDHLCRNPCCGNSEHLDPTTVGGNVLRGAGWAGRNSRATHCPKGHPYNDQNTYYIKSGGRRCRECNRLKQLECAERRLSGKLIREYPKKSHCDKGHPFDENNTYISKTTGQRYCKACRRLYAKKYYEERHPQASDEN